MFGIFSDQVGHGIVGGSLVDAHKMGKVTAELAVSMLEHTGQPGDPVVVATPMPPPTFDWRELKHWGIPESRLPAGAVVQFRPPTLWEQHKGLIIAGSCIVLLQTALIASLLIQRLLRRRAERTTNDLSGRLLTADEDERRMG